MGFELALLHGSGYTSESFNQQRVAFPQAIALALPGHPVGQALATVSECASWLNRRLAEGGRESAVVAGNSLGGAIALQWALDFPDRARGLILIGSGARLRVSNQIFSMIENDWPACVPTLVDLALSAAAPADLRLQAARWHEAVGQENTRRDYAACNGFDVMGELGRLAVPALVIVGSEDRMTPVKYSQYLHEHLRGSRLTVIPGAGHLTMAEKPAETNAAIGEFLRAVGASS